MIIYLLGATLEEISLDKMDEFSYEKSEPENEATASEFTKQVSDEGFVFVGKLDEAVDITRLANVSYDGEINLKSIEFCKIESQQECLAGTLRIPRISDICGSKFQLQFFVNKRNIVIIDDSGFAQKQILKIKMKRTKQGQTRERFLYNFLIGIISQDLEILNRYERQMMKMDEEVMDHHFENYQSKSANIRKQLLTLREYYDELRDLGKQLEEDENHFFSKKNLKYFGTVSDRADRLMNRTLHLLDYMGQIRDTYNQKVSEEQNKNMEFLTIISTIFFPLTLITGWYGMNFENMPELEQGYPYVIVLSLVIVTLIIVMLKKKKII
ncbi:MAG: CorA family divalent cation transporter [Lachnospiraceae bacterium]